jgi:DNA-directed RNA polymerase specialized sigma24 family protein
MVLNYIFIFRFAESHFMTSRSQPSIIKYLLLIICGALFFVPTTSFSQTISTEKLIDELKEDGVYQTQKFDGVCMDLHYNFNEEKFLSKVEEAKKYLKNNPNIRLEVRLFLYERSGYLKINKLDPLNTLINYSKMIKLAGPLGDDQLLTDLYVKYAAICTTSEKLYFLLKCIEIRERTGLKYFSDVSSNYYNASELLFKNVNYKSSASYAVRGIALYTESKKRDFLFQYILATDIAGASYLQINKPDSAIYYYKHIGYLIDDRLAHPGKYKSPMTPEMLQIWRGVINGGIGKAYFLKKKYDIAYDLLLKNLKSSQDFKQWEDVAGLQNELAKIDNLRKNTHLALARHIIAYRLASKSDRLALLVNSAEGLSTSYANIGQYDSAYVYQKIFLQQKNKLDNNINQSRLDIAKSQVNFEKMQKAFQQSENDVINQKRIRNSILIAIIFLTVIALLLYNRKRLQLRIQKEVAEKEKQKAENEINYAQQQIGFFTHNIAEKNNLIEQLQTQLKTDNLEINVALQNFTILTEDDWQTFKTNFETINPNYLHRLKQKMPLITQGEQRIILLSKLGFNNKEMANATGVSSETIRSVISRMRKKFKLDADIRTIVNEI